MAKILFTGLLTSHYFSYFSFTCLQGKLAEEKIEEKIHTYEETRGEIDSYFHRHIRKLLA